MSASRIRLSRTSIEDTSLRERLTTRLVTSSERHDAERVAA
jgi:hypothetical protein